MQRGLSFPSQGMTRRGTPPQSLSKTILSESLCQAFGWEGTSLVSRFSGVVPQLFCLGCAGCLLWMVHLCFNAIPAKPIFLTLAQSCHVLQMEHYKSSFNSGELLFLFLVWFCSKHGIGVFLLFQYMDTRANLKEMLGSQVCIRGSTFY